MRITPYRDIDNLLPGLLHDIQQVLDKQLVGLYLFGSLVTGDFDREVSDIDLLAATASDINQQEFDRLDQMHDRFISTHPKWENRLEIAYTSVPALQTLKSQVSRIAIISPGEPFHFKEAGKDWLINWWVVRENGVPLFGPDPRHLIAPISKAEFLRAVQEQAQEWRDYVIHARDSRPYQGYVILTMCRALYAYKHGEQVSKQQAAAWATNYLPEWSWLIHQALAWRAAWRDQTVDHAATFPQTATFVNVVADHIANS